MSKHELIIKGQIGEKRQAQLRVVTKAKAALRALIEEAIYAKNKQLAEIDTAVLQVHLSELAEQQELFEKLEEEIKELSY